ncbi:MAG: hypothetical protein JXA72_08590 [Bacteroidales bacterium]|nr:hypothetical protein [Bacteroidales bacterium]
MKIKFVLLLLSVSLLISCKKEEKEFNEYYPDGKLWKKSVYESSKDKDKNYTLFEFFESGSIKSVTRFENGMKQGRCISYYDRNEVAESVFFYENDKLSGIGRYYGKDGMITDKGLFINDSLVVKEEFYTNGKYTQLRVFTKKNGAFIQNGKMLYDDQNRVGLDNSEYYLAFSADSVRVDDSLEVRVMFFALGKDDGHIALTLGRFDENLVSLSREKIILSDSLSTTFFYKPSRKGYNLITGKLLYVVDRPKEKVSDFVFYHDFLAY